MECPACGEILTGPFCTECGAHVDVAGTTVLEQLSQSDETNVAELTSDLHPLVPADAEAASGVPPNGEPSSQPASEPASVETRSHRTRTIVIAGVAVLALVGVALSGWLLAANGASSSDKQAAKPHASAAPSTSSSADGAGAATISVPVVPCTTQFGVTGQTLPAPPASLSVAMAKQTAEQLSFYSNSAITVLAPKGWTCAGLVAADGIQQLNVVPPGQAQVTIGEPSSSDTQGITTQLDYTGHGPGAFLVCGLFPGTPAALKAAAIAPCSTIPAQEQVQRPTPDTAIFSDPPGVRGSGDPSGGRYGTYGVVIYPQTADASSGDVTVAKASCTLASNAGLCKTIIADFVARQSPPTLGASTTSVTTTTAPPVAARGLNPHGMSTDGVAPLNFGDSYQRAAELVGVSPDASRLGCTPTIDGALPGLSLQFNRDDGTFIYYNTTNPSHETLSGVHVGMSVGELQARVPYAQRETPPWAYGGTVFLVRSKGNSLGFFVSADGTKIDSIAAAEGDTPLSPCD
jgi:hypothetical protein